MRNLFIIIILFSYSCHEDIERIESTQASQDHLYAEFIFNDLGLVVHESLNNNGVNKSCLTYNLSNLDNTNEDTLILDFGAENCLFNNHLRRGKIITVFNGGYNDSLTLITTTLENYYINNKLVLGERSIINKGRNSSGNICFEIKIINGNLSTENGTINWQCDYIFEWTTDNNTPFNLLDDEYMISGNANGVSVNNNNFNIEIIKPLIIDLKCLNMGKCSRKSGEATVSPNNYQNRSINYGEECDCNATVTIEKNEYSLTIN